MEDQIFNVSQMSDATFGTMAKRRFNEASGHWEKKYQLKSTRTRSHKNYLAEYVEEQLVDDRYEEVFVDNKHFTALRTLLPFLTGRLTAPQVTPANGDDDSMQFAVDFEKGLQLHAERQQGRAKARLAIQDVLRGERIGYLKWRYDASTNNVVLEYVPANCVVIGKRSRLFEEPDFLRHTQPRSVGDLIRQFPDKEQKILELFDVKKGVPSQLEKEHNICEDWIWADVDGEKTLLVGWSYQNFVFGKMTDPNRNENGNNVTEQSIIPFVFFNLLNDGTGYVDETSFMDQSRWIQSNYNKRGQVIAESAKYGGTGVPIFAKDAIGQKDVAKIKFSPIQRVLLNAPDVTKAFTTWQQGPLQPFIMEDKQDLATSHDNIWGVPDVLRGEQTDSRTMGQDLLVRDQAEGRQADPIDCIDDSMTRFYIIEAQMMYRYFDEKKFYNYLGDDGKFVSVVIQSPQIAKNLGIVIGVQAGTSLPIDRAQRRATIMELMKMKAVSLLVAYKELGLFDDPEAAYQQYVKEQVLPFSAMEDAGKALQSREAEQDLQDVIGNSKPTERDDVTDDYMQHLTNYLITNKYHMLEKADPKAARRVDQFVQDIIAQAKLKMAKMQNQQAIANPNTMMPPVRAKETMNYRDLPPDVQAQMETNQGYQASAVHQLEQAAGVSHVGTNTSTVIPPQQQPGMEGLMPGQQQQSPQAVQGAAGGQPSIAELLAIDPTAVAAALAKNGP